MEKESQFNKETNLTKKNKILNVARSAILAASILSPLGSRIDTASADPNFEGAEVARITGYYCLKVVGYKGYDNGGYCGTPAHGGRTISGETAACGRNFQKFERIIIEGYPKVLTCNDTGYLAPNQIDIYWLTDKELHDAYLPSHARILRLGRE